jgi:hypothetical protein
MAISRGPDAMKTLGIEGGILNRSERYSDSIRNTKRDNTSTTSLVYSGYHNSLSSPSTKYNLSE